jgi:hypothetical protein
MVRSSSKALVGFTISATDGDIGRVETLYFDDQHWTVRYLVVDTGGWLTDRRVLVSPVCVRQPQWRRRRLPVALTRAEVQASPSVDTHAPISRQYEIAFSQYYGIPHYWAASLGAPPYPLIAPEVAGAIASELQAHVEQQEAEDQHLRSTEDVRGYRLRTTDGEIGHVEDFLIEDLTWRVRYLDVDTRNWWPGKHVLVAPEWIEGVSWGESAVHVALATEVIRQAPPFDRARPVDRAYEQKLYAYYGHAGYWEERAVA